MGSSQSFDNAAIIYVITHFMMEREMWMHLFFPFLLFMLRAVSD